ncbi:hypothetical protein, partial [Streptomyces niger]|uniref:hypothetical protein n=1 Tax=Streptomyces niger TaxID=66373 RepID=UPI00069C5C0D
GLAFAVSPGVQTLFGTLPDDQLPSWIRESRNTLKATGKALVAWDEWGKNPARAAGGVTFNVLTTVFTGGAGGAAAGVGKAGAVTRAISVAGKVGKVIDPMTYVGKAAGAGLSKVGDIAKSLKGIGKVDVSALPADAIKLPEGSLKLPDGTVHLPEGAPLPEGATRLPDGNVQLPDDVPALPKDANPLPTGPGESARYFDGQGNLLDEHGKVLHSIDDAPKEDVGDVGRTGDDVHPTGTHAGDRLPGAGDHLSSGRPGEHFSGGSLGDHMPGSRADDLGTGPSASHEPPPSHTGGHGGGAGEGHGGHEAIGGGHGSGPEAADHHGPARGHSGTPHGADHETSAGGHGNGPGIGDDAAGSGSQVDEGGTPRNGVHGPEQELTPERRKEILEEQIWKANNDDAWFEKYYRPDGHRWSIRAKENGVELPILAKDRQGNWISKHALPSGPSEVRFDQQAFHPGSVRDEHAGHLDDVAKGRRVSVDLNNAEREFKDTHSEAAHEALHDAQEAYTEHHGDTPNNSKHSEKLGEDAARYHVIPEKFPDAEWVELPKTPSGANMFDQLYKLDNGDYLIVEAKAPSADLGWRQGVGDTAGGMMVKQGTKEYVHTILQEMWNRGLRSPRDAELADELFDALEDKKLQYVLVKANDNPGTTYAGAVLEHFRIS